MKKIEEIDDSQESEEEFKKIDEYVKKKVREDNIIKTPEKSSLSLNVSPDVSASDRKDLIKKNKSLDDDHYNKHDPLYGSKNDNKILSLLNQTADKGQTECKSDGIPTNNSILEEHPIPQIITINNELTPIKLKNNSKKSKAVLENESPQIDNRVLMDDSVVKEKKSPLGRKKTPRKTQKKSKSKKIYEAIEHHSIMESLPTQGDIQNNKKDEIFGEKIESQYERLKKVSPFGNFNTFKLFKVIIKNGEDLRQEQFATQLINEFYQIFQLEEVDIWLKPYEILSTGHNVGLIECVPNSVSLDYLKRKSKNITTLNQYFETYFGPTNSERYKTAISNFIKSLAGYSLVCYFLQIKDRHNGNILIDDQGHIIHIDFGFMLSNAPGKGIQFEKAPFKLTKEYLDVIGGVKTENFSKFRKLLWKGFIAASKHYEKILILIEMMYCGHGNNLPCFVKGINTIEELRQRFVPRNNMKKHDYISHVDSLIEMSIDNWRTKWYDKYQYYFQGIFY